MLVGTDPRRVAIDNTILMYCLDLTTKKPQDPLID
jgi:hypothetical protein